MTLHGTGFTETTTPPSRKTPAEAHSAMDTVDVLAPALKEKLQQVAETSKARVTEWRDGFQNGVRSRPIQSVLIAAAVGTVIGLIFGRRSR